MTKTLSQVEAIKALYEGKKLGLPGLKSESYIHIVDDEIQSSRGQPVNIYNLDDFVLYEEPVHRLVQTITVYRRQYLELEAGEFKAKFYTVSEGAWCASKEAYMVRFPKSWGEWEEKDIEVPV